MVEQVLKRELDSNIQRGKKYINKAKYNEVTQIIYLMNKSPKLDHLVENNTT